MVLPAILAAAPAMAAGLSGAAATGAAATAIPALAGAAGATAAPALAGGLSGAALTGAGGLGAGTALGGAGAGGIAGGALSGAGMTGAGMGMGTGAAGAGMAAAAPVAAKAAPLAASQVGGTAPGLGGIGANPNTAYVPKAVSTKLMANGMNPTLAKGLGGIADKGSAMFTKMGQNPMQSLNMASKLANMGQGQQQQAPRAAPTGGGVNRALQNVDQGTADDIREQMGLSEMGRDGGRIGRGMNRRIMAGGGRPNSRRIG